MSDNVAFLTKRINAHKADIEHITNQMKRCLDSQQEQLLKSEVIMHTKDIQNYEQILNGLKAS